MPSNQHGRSNRQRIYSNAVNGARLYACEATDDIQNSLGQGALPTHCLFFC